MSSPIEPLSRPLPSSSTLMTPPSDLPLPTTLPAPKRDGADLVFTQDGSGRFCSLTWQAGGIESTAISSQLSSFEPIAPATYIARIQSVLEDLAPLRFDYVFVCEGRYHVFDLILSPILLPQGTANLVVGMGQFLRTVSYEKAMELIGTPFATAPQQTGYRQQLNLVIGNIRRSLDMETIWQQTVVGLGEALQVDRCILCPYKPLGISSRVVAEYRLPSLSPLLGTEIKTAEVYFSQALATLEPVVVVGEGESILAIATPYKSLPNGVILLYQSQPHPTWDEVDMALLKELADQVGTGVAHATLLEESRNLAAELQRANETLMERNREIEEARQQAEAASRLKSEFLANTSHELRTPLNGVIGFLKLIMDGMADDPEEQGQFIEEAHRSAIHLLSIINDILDVAKIEAGKMQLDLNPIKLDDLLSDVENFIRPQAQQKALSLEILTPATRDEVVVLGNYQRLLQVMLNLLSNAVKFTHEGGITITAEVLPDKILVQNQEKPGSVKVSVADTGIGVSLEKQDKLFQSFSQVDGSRTRQYGGTGLGLAISQKLVEAMGGVVNFYSMGEGLGSTVTFTVPLYHDPVMISASLTDSPELL
jgi:signal transduction histidine kinase